MSLATVFPKRFAVKVLRNFKSLSTVSNSSFSTLLAEIILSITHLNPDELVYGIQPRYDVEATIQVTSSKTQQFQSYILHSPTD